MAALLELGSVRLTVVGRRLLSVSADKRKLKTRPLTPRGDAECASSDGGRRHGIHGMVLGGGQGCDGCTTGTM